MSSSSFSDDPNTVVCIDEFVVLVSPESGLPQLPNYNNISCEIEMHQNSDNFMVDPIVNITYSEVGLVPLTNGDNMDCSIVEMHQAPNNCSDKSIVNIEFLETRLALLRNGDNIDYSIVKINRYPTENCTNKPFVKIAISETDLAPLMNYDNMADTIIEMHQDLDNFTDKPFFKSSSTRAGSPSLSKNENICSFVVLCPPDGGFWQKLAYMLGFISLLIFDGVYSSFYLLDSRVGMTTEYLPPGTRILENLATVYLFCYLTERFSCAYINRYGFRYCLFIGGILSITWLTLLYFTENVFVHEYLFLAIIGGGIGMGMIKTSFFVLLSTLIVVYRHTEHLCLQLGSFTGKMLISAVTEYQSLYSNLIMVPHIYLVLVLLFWLFVTTPMPIKLEATDGYLINPRNPPKSKIMSVVWDVKHFFKKHQAPTIEYIIENRQFWVGRFLANIPISSYLHPTKSAINSLNWLYNEYKNWILGVQNVDNMSFIV